MLINPVFLHGWAFSSKVFENFAGIKIDLPFHGSSDLNYENLSGLVDQLVMSLPAKHDLVGWSMGGSLAVLMAIKYPTKVNRLVLIGATACFGEAWNKKNIRAFISMIKREKYAGVNRFRKEAYGDNFTDFINLEGSLRFLKDYINLKLSQFLPYLKKEVLVIHGEEDRIVPIEEAFKLYSMLKNAKLITLPGGHFPVRYESELIYQVLKGG